MSDIVLDRPAARCQCRADRPGERAGPRQEGGRMSDRMLFVSWGVPVRGREERALEVFEEVVGLYGRLQQEGRIERFDVVLLAPTPGIDGYIQVHGTAEQLAGLRVDEEWLRSIAAAGLVVEDLRIVDGYANEGVAQMMALYQEAIAKLPQRA